MWNGHTAIFITNRYLKSVFDVKYQFNWNLIGKLVFGN